MRTWRPDVDIDCNAAHRIVQQQFAEFSCMTPRLLGRGWDNLCVEYPNGIVFRLPTRKEGAQILLNEIPVLPAIAPLLPLPVPQPLYHGVPDGSYPYHFIGYAIIPGRTSDQVPWSAIERRVAAGILGRFLHELHAVDITRPPFSILPGDTGGKAEPAKLMNRVELRFNQLETLDPAPDPLLKAALQAAQELANQPAPLSFRPTLVHGDLYPRHLLANDAHEITGVIDWGDVHVGNPAIDLSLAFSFFEPDERLVFWAAYGETPDQETVRIARLRAVMYGFALLAYGEEVDEAAARMGREILRRISLTPR